MKYYTEFIGHKKVIELVKQNIPKELSIIKEYPSSYQYHIEFSDQPKKKLIVFYDKNDEVHINFDTLHNIKDQVFSALYNVLNFNDLEPGNESLGRTFYVYNPKLGMEIKKAILDTLGVKVKEYKPIANHKFLLKLKGEINIVHEKSGLLTIAGKPNKVSDLTIDIINKKIDEYESINIIKRKKIEVIKKSYNEFLRENIETPLVKNITPEIYDFMDGLDILEIEDGLKIYRSVKENNIKLNNYKLVVRSFVIAAEGFLIKLFLELGLIPELQYKNNPTIARIGQYLSQFRTSFKDYYRITSPALPDKIATLWFEYRHKYLHSDKFYPFKLKNMKDAEEKITEILKILDEIMIVFKDFLNSKENLITKENQTM